LPAPLQQWLELWHQQRPNVATRLVALLNAAPPEHLPLAPAFRELTSFALRTGVGVIWCGALAEAEASDARPRTLVIAVAS
jgi:hypothetical protein